MKIGRLLITIITFTIALLFSGNKAMAVNDEYEGRHFADTIRSANKQAQFRKAIEVAPSTFVYKELVWKDKNTVTIKRMRFNESIKRTLDNDVVKYDPGLEKRLRKLYTVMRPLNPTIDLTISFHDVPEGIAVTYDISNVRVFGAK